MKNQKSKANLNTIPNYKKNKNKYKNIFIFILFFISVVKFSVCESNYYSENNNPCNPEDSWVLYENQYKDTIIVTDPYAE